MLNDDVKKKHVGFEAIGDVVLSSIVNAVYCMSFIEYMRESTWSQLPEQSAIKWRAEAGLHTDVDE